MPGRCGSLPCRRSRNADCTEGTPPAAAAAPLIHSAGTQLGMRTMGTRSDKDPEAPLQGKTNSVFEIMTHLIWSTRTSDIYIPGLTFGIKFCFEIKEADVWTHTLSLYDVRTSSPVKKTKLQKKLILNETFNNVLITLCCTIRCKNVLFLNFDAGFSKRLLLKDIYYILDMTKLTVLYILEEQSVINSKCNAFLKGTVAKKQTQNRLMSRGVIKMIENGLKS